MVEYTKKRLAMNFLLMATSFSINHATVTALIGLATTNLDPDTGNLQTALLYTLYTLTALLGAQPIAGYLGDKLSMVAGLTLYVVYDSSFILADMAPQYQKPVACIGGCIGGFAAGFLWTAQFSYFGKNAALYAKAARVELTEEMGGGYTEAQITEYAHAKASSKFAAWFAVPYLGFEVLFKLTQSYVGQSSGPASAHWSAGKDMIYVINTGSAVCSTLACCCILNLDDQFAAETPAKPKRSFLTDVSSAARLFVTDPKMPLMVGMNIVFGFSTAYMNGYVTSIVVPFYIHDGDTYGGYLLAVSAAVAALLSIPNTIGLLSNVRSKKWLMVLGPVAFGISVLLPLVLGYRHVAGRHGWGLLGLYILQGIGRGVWESTNKAIFLDYFAADKVGAGSNIIVQNGGATAVAFYLNTYSPAMPTRCVGDCPAYAMEAWATFTFSVLAILGFLGASTLHARGVSTWAGALGKNDGPSEDTNQLFLPDKQQAATEVPPRLSSTSLEETVVHHFENNEYLSLHPKHTST